MTHGGWKTLGWWTAGASLGLLLAAGSAVADEKQVIEELRARMEALEKQNQLLMQALQKGQVPGVVLPAGGEEDKPLAGADQVKKIVGDYLKERDDKKKKEDEEKKKEADEKGFEVGKNLSMTARWDHGLWAETADKAFRVHVGGRTQVDGAWMTADNNVQFGARGTGRIDDGVNFRRARLEVDGTIFEVIEFWCEYDFLNTFNAERTGDPLVANTPAPTDLFFTITHLPLVGNCRIGNQKPPISFERLTSSRFLNFMERSFSVDAFVNGLDNGFRPGVQLFNSVLDQRLHWAVGVFKNNNSAFGWNAGDGEYDVTARLTGLPWYEHDGRCLLHVGVGASHRDLDDDQARFRARTLLRNGPGALHTTLADVRLLGGSQDLIVPELALVVGPFTLQTEYYATWVQDARFPITPAADRVNRGTTFFQGYYVEALYFLTGEHRAYNKRIPGFTRVVPHENFFYVPGECGNLLGRGAWQVGVRYSYIDLENKGVAGGTVHDVTLGLNWFLNPNAKVQWNYIWEHRDVPGNTSDGTVQGFGVRLAFDF